MPAHHHGLVRIVERGSPGHQVEGGGRQRVLIGPAGDQVGLAFETLAVVRIDGHRRVQDLQRVLAGQPVG